MRRRAPKSGRPWAPSMGFWTSGAGSPPRRKAVVDAARSTRVEHACRPRSKWDVLNDLDAGRCARTAPHWYLAGRPDAPTRSAAACALGGPHGAPRPAASTSGRPCWRSRARFDVGDFKNRRQLFLPSRRRPLGSSSERCCRGRPAPVRAHLAGPAFFSVWALSGDTGSAVRGAVDLGRRCRPRPGASNHMQPAHGTRAPEHRTGSGSAQLDWAAWGDRRRQQNQPGAQRGLRIPRMVSLSRWEARASRLTDGGEDNRVNAGPEGA